MDQSYRSALVKTLLWRTVPGNRWYIVYCIMCDVCFFFFLSITTFLAEIFFRFSIVAYFLKAYWNSSVYRKKSFTDFCCCFLNKWENVRQNRFLCSQFCYYVVIRLKISVETFGFHNTFIITTLEYIFYSFWRLLSFLVTNGWYWIQMLKKWNASGITTRKNDQLGIFIQQ